MLQKKFSPRGCLFKGTHKALQWDSANIQPICLLRKCGGRSLKIFTEQVELGCRRGGKLQSRTPSQERKDVMDAHKVMKCGNSKDCSPRAARLVTRKKQIVSMRT